MQRIFFCKRVWYKEFFKERRTTIIVCVLWTLTKNRMLFCVKWQTTLNWVIQNVSFERYWLTYRMTDLQNDRLTEWQNYRMTDLQNDRLTKWQTYRMTDLQNDRLTELQTDIFTDWLTYLPSYLLFYLLTYLLTYLKRCEDASRNVITRVGCTILQWICQTYIYMNTDMDTTNFCHQASTAFAFVVLILYII